MQELQGIAGIRKLKSPHEMQELQELQERALRADSQWPLMTVQPRYCIQKLPVGASTPLTAGMSADEGVACAEDSAS